MSQSLVKLSLSLFDDDLKQMNPVEKKKKKKPEEPLALLGTQKKGVKKKILKMKCQTGKKKQKEATRKSAIEKYLEQQPNDFTEESVQKLQRISQLSATDSKISNVILDYHYKTRKLRRPDDKETQKEESTMFNEEDFEKFQKEYDFDK